MGKYVCIVAGVAAVTIIECIALCKGYNHSLLTAAIAAILSLIGFLFGVKIGTSNEKKRGLK